MSKQNKLIVIPDTNIFLHYRRLDEIDWLREMNAASVDIIIAPVILRELEKQKVYNQKKHLRHRAEERIKWLTAKILSSSEAEVTIRDEIKVIFLNHEPTIDFKQHNLIKDLLDDVIIAHAIELAEKDDNHVVLLGADGGILAKGLNRKPEVLLWGDNKYKLPEEQDAVEKENARLKQEVQLLRNRIPELRLCFENGDDHKAYALSKTPDEQLKTELDQVWQQAKNLGQKRFPGEFDAMGYDWACREYCKAYESYLNKLSCFRQHVVAIELVLQNTGTCVAKDTDLELSLRADLDVRHEYELPEKPVPPDPKAYTAYDDGGLVFISAAASYSNPQQDSIRAIVDSTKGLVSYKVDRLKHCQSVALGTIYVVFEDLEKVQSFSIGYKLVSESVPHRVDGTLHVNVTVDI